MLETPHVFIGAAIASKIPNPFIAVPLAFASHFILETIPHWNPHLNTETEKYGKPTQKSTIIVAVDATIALISGTIIAARALPNTWHALGIFIACFASVLPDVIEGPYFFLNSRTKWAKKWISIQRTLQNDTTPFWGLLAQFATILAAIWWIKN